MQQLVRRLAPAALFGNEVVNVASFVLQNGHASRLHVLLVQRGNLAEFIPLRIPYKNIISALVLLQNTHRNLMAIPLPIRKSAATQ